MSQDHCDLDLEKQNNQGTGPGSASSVDQNRHDLTESHSGSIPPEKEDAIQTNEPEVPDGVLGKTISRAISRMSTLDIGPPPDGGIGAWTQVVMAHLSVFNTWGYINTFGVFQTYYVAALNHPPSSISWVGSAQIFLLFFIGTFSGRATDYGLFRVTYLLGSIFQVLGVFMTSISTKYWQLFLAQGICTGIGNGLVFCPVLALVSTYFSSKKSLAISIVACGTASGGLVFPAIVQQLLPRIGFPWTVRIIGFVMLGVQCVAFAFLKTRVPPRKAGPVVEWQAFREIPYALFCIATFLIFWSLYFAFYYIGSFARDIIHVSETDSINLLLILNGVGALGRLVPGYLADKYFGPLNIFIPFAFVSGLLIYCWAAVSSKDGLIAFAVVYGIFAAGIQGLFAATLTSLTADLKKAGVRIGMCFSVVSFACLTGSPLAGALIQKDEGEYIGAQMYAASVMIAGCALLLATRVAKIGWIRGRV